MDPPQKGPPWSTWRESEIHRLERFHDERVDGIRHPGRIPWPRNLGTLNRTKRPHPFIVLCANGNRNEYRQQKGGQQESVHLRSLTGFSIFGINRCSGQGGHGC